MPRHPTQSIEKLKKEPARPLKSFRVVQRNEMSVENLHTYGNSPKTAGGNGVPGRWLATELDGSIPYAAYRQEVRSRASSYVGVAQRLVRWIANSVMRVQFPSPTHNKTGQQLFYLHWEHEVVGSNPTPGPNVPDSSVGRARIQSVLGTFSHPFRPYGNFGRGNIWPYRIEVITSGCLPEDQGSIPCRVASRLDSCSNSYRDEVWRFIPPRSALGSIRVQFYRTVV